MQRFSGASPVASPHRPNYGKPSPLARVTEETAAPIKVHTSGIPSAKLVEVDSPKPIEENKQSKVLESLLEPVTLEDSKEETKSKEAPLEATTLIDDSDGTKKATVEDEAAMKTIEI